MRIATIVQSTSHLDYRARVLDELETATPPEPATYGFGQWVAVPVAQTSAIGVLYNSQLIVPDGMATGPRLSTPSEQRAIFTPDYLREHGILLSLLLVGWREGKAYHQGVPRLVVPVQAPVETLSPDEVLAFHQGADGGVTLAYYPIVATHAGLFAPTLLEAILDQLDGLVSDLQRARLRILRKSLAWQTRVESLR
jgi:hypothetical protein